MKTLTLRNRFQGNTTIIENDFIDHYMIHANGEYVKVYLLLLRHLNTPDISLTISKLADCLDCTEKDILRALKYWAKKGLLKIDYDETNTICGISVGQSSSESTLEPVTETVSAKPVRKTKTKTQASNEQMRQLYFVAEQYIGKPLSVTDLQKINYFYDTLHFSVDLIEYLIEYCVENGHKNMHYIETVALSWSDNHITTVAEAKESSSLYHKNYFAVLKAFGISGRNPAPIEADYIRRWLEEYGFPMEIILEACNRTIANTAKPDFKYADSILTNWFKSHVQSLKDVARLDEEHQQKKTTKRKPVAKPAAKGKTGFNNFQGRTYDITSLEQKLLNNNS